MKKVCIIFVGFILAIFAIQATALAQVSGSRDLPDCYYPGSPITTELDLEVDEANTPNGVIIKEYIPTGWEITSTYPSYNSFNAAKGELKWLFYGAAVTDTDMDISYTLSVPQDANGFYSFKGNILFNDSNGDPVTMDIAGEGNISDIEETITKPGAPSGETHPTVGEAYAYTTTGANSNLGHTVEYQFTWGDGTQSDWSTSKSAAKTWDNATQRTVTVTARCTEHTDKTNTSDGLNVNPLESQPLIADAGPDQTVDEGVTVTLDGSNSSGPDDGIASYQWTQTDGPSVTLSDPITIKPSFTAPSGGVLGKTLIFELRVKDSGGLLSTDTVTITVFATVISDGDVAPLGNRDKKVNVGDALIALRFALGLEIPTQEDKQHGDVAPLDSNGKPDPDGEITVGDALVILRKALGIIEF